MARRTRAQGGRFLVASWPLLVDLDAYPFTAADDAIARFCAEAGIPRVDLRLALADHAAESLWVHPVDHHPNELAHALAADALVDPVRAQAASIAGPPSKPCPSTSVELSRRGTPLAPPHSRIRWAAGNVKTASIASRREARARRSTQK